MKPKLPVQCPACQQSLLVSQLQCKACETQVQGKYDLPVLAQLPEEEQDFILQFFLNSGSLKKMAEKMGSSYPTIRNKLDDIILKIKELNK